MSDPKPMPKPYEYGRIAENLIKGNLELAKWMLQGGPCAYAKRAKLLRDK